MRPPANTSIEVEPERAAIKHSKKYYQFGFRRFVPIQLLTTNPVSRYSGKAVKPIALRWIYELALPPVKNIPSSGIGELLPKMCGVLLVPATCR